MTRDRPAAIAADKTAILFDLDGTLIDPKAGICGSLRYVLKALGEPAPSEDDLAWAIGPPMIDSLKRLLGESRAQEGLKLYRARYGEIGLYDNEIYDGVPAMLETVRNAGFALYVATSKLEIFAKKILTHLNLAHLFTEIAGADPQGKRDHKDVLLAHLLQEHAINPKAAVMIGDRKFDILGAKANGVRSIGVTWGYSARTELLSAGADCLADRPSDVLAAIKTLAL